MNTRRIITAGALILIVAVTAVSIISGIYATQDPKETTASATEASLVSTDARRIYSDAARSVANMCEQTVSCVIQQQMTTGTQTYTLDTNRIMRATGMGNADMSVLVNETVSIGDHTVSCSEAFSDGTAYISVDNNPFYCEMSAEDFIKRQIPAAILDETLYAQVDGYLDGENTYITFSDASGGENWAMPDGAQFISAEGTATLDTALSLVESTYLIRYQLGETQIEKNVRVGVSSSVAGFAVPTQETAQPVNHPDAVRALEYACGYLTQCTDVEAKISEVIICEAYGDQRVQNTQINMLAEGTNCTATLDITTSLTNAAKTDSTTQKEQHIHYEDSQYSVSVDGADPVVQSGITPLMMKTYCHDYFLSTMILPQYITGAQITDESSTYRYDFTANDSFAHLLCQSASEILYQDPSLLVTLSGEYSVEGMDAYLQVDKITGLPVSSGIKCIVSHSVAGFPYRLQYDIQQQYTISAIID